MQKMTHTERIRAILAGKPTDRLPYVAWGPHMNLEDRHEGDFTKAVIAYQERFQFDVLKIMSNGLYNVEDLGVEYTLPKHPDDQGFRLITKAAYNSIDDWAAASKKDPYSGTMGREVRVMRNLKEHFGDSVPILPTIFGPYRTLRGASMTLKYSFVTDGGKRLRDIVIENEDVFRHVMEVMTEQVMDLMEAFINSGADGFFYCPNGDVYADDQEYEGDGFSTEEYYRYFREYDERILNAIKDRTWFNVLHIHGSSNLRINELCTLPGIQAINWEDQSPYNPSLAQIREKTDRILMGGLDRVQDFLGEDREKVKSVLKMKVEEAVRQAGPKLILAPGCEASRTSNHRFSVLEEVIDEIAKNNG